MTYSWRVARSETHVGGDAEEPIMPRLTLRTLLAYIDDTLEPTETRALGKKVAESDEAKTSWSGSRR